MVSSTRHFFSDFYQLTDVQVQELKKAFAIADTHGNGELTPQEVGVLLQRVSFVNPTQQEVANLMRLMDSNNDGKVQWEEFLAVMKDWLQDPTVQASSDKKRKRGDDDTEREDIHRKISKFFMQFRSREDIQEARSRIAVAMRDPRYMLSEDSQDGLFDENGHDKKAALEKIQRVDVQTLAHSLVHANNQEAAHTAIKGFINVLSILVYYKTPLERREIADELIRIFSAFLSSVEKLVQVLRNAAQSSNVVLMVDTLRVINFLMNGPRIASTPEDNKFHANKQIFKKEFAKFGAIELIIDLMDKRKLPYKPVHHQAMLCIGNYCAHHSDTRDAVLQYPDQRVLKLIMAQFAGAFSGQIDAAFLRKGTWVLHILCSNVAGHPTPPDYNLVKVATPLIGELFLHFGKHYRDERSLDYICGTMSYLLPGVREDAVFVKLIELFLDQSEFVVELSLRTINRLLLAEPNVATALVDKGLLKCIKSLIYSTNKDIALAALRVVGTLASVCGCIDAIIKSDIIPSICDVITKNAQVRWKAVKLLKYLSRGSASQIQYLVKHCNIINMLCHNVLPRFIEQDQLLARVYKYESVSYNFELIHDALMTLSNVMHSGEFLKEEVLDEATSGISSPGGNDAYNPYAIAFDAGCIDRLGELLRLIKSGNTKVINAWRNQSSAHRLGNVPDSPRKGGGDSNSHSLEDTVRALLVKVKLAADNPKFRTNQSARVVSEKIQTIMKLYYDNSQSEEEQLLHQFMTKYMTATGRVKVLMSSGMKSPVLLNPGLSIESYVDLRKTENFLKQQMFSELNRFTVTQQNEINMDTIEKLFEFFCAKCNKDTGLLEKAPFVEGLRQICNILDPIVLEHSYTLFDNDHNGYIDFREFVCGLCLMQKQENINDPLMKMLFRAYDLDNNGFISKEEVFKIFKHYKLMKGEFIGDQNLIAMVNQVFSQVDFDNDEQLNFSEFKSAVMRGLVIVRMV